MKLYKLRLKKYLANRALHRAYNVADAERDRWHRDYDCGRQMYDHLSGGRLTKLEDVAREKYKECIRIDKLISEATA